MYGKIREIFNDAKLDFLFGDSLVARAVTRAMIGKDLAYRFGDYVIGVDDTLKRLAQQENLKYRSSVLDTLCAPSVLESFSAR